MRLPRMLLWLLRQCEEVGATRNALERYPELLPSRPRIVTDDDLPLHHRQHEDKLEVHNQRPQPTMAEFNWRTINIDALDPESSYNFDLSTLTPAVQPVSTADVQTLAGQVRQLLRGGNPEGALRGALENPPYGADDQGKVCHQSNKDTAHRLDQD